MADRRKKSDILSFAAQQDVKMPGCFVRQVFG